MKKGKKSIDKIIRKLADQVPEHIRSCNESDVRMEVYLWIASLRSKRKPISWPVAVLNGLGSLLDFSPEYEDHIE